VRSMGRKKKWFRSQWQGLIHPDMATNGRTGFPFMKSVAVKFIIIIIIIIIIIDACKDSSLFGGKMLNMHVAHFHHAHA